MRSISTIGIIGLIGCSGDKSLTVQNPAPTADIISHDTGAEILEGFVVTLEGVVSDPNHTPDQLTTRWKVNDEIVCDDIVPEDDGSTFCDVVFGPDDTQIELEVRDAENKPGFDTIDVVVVETEAPMVEILSPMSEGVYYSDQLIAFEGIASDAEDDSELLMAYWESNADDVLVDVDGEVSNSGEVLGYGTLTEGQHAIELHVEDTTGKTSTESVLITVGPPNTAPDCAIVTPVDGSAGPQGDVVTFEGTASDVDVAADWLTVTWTSDKDGEIGSLSPNSQGGIVFSYADLSVNTHTISMQVADEVGATCTSTMTYTVGTAPSITIDAPVDGDVINEGTPITFSATVSDSQDQPDVIGLDWVVDGSSISTQSATSSGEATFSDSTFAFGTYNLVLTATDTDGLTDSDQINFTVNGLPSTPVVSINPDPATTSEGLSVIIDTPSVDPEGLTPTYSYEWQLGGQPQASYTTSSLPSSATSKGEQWTVVVTPNDGMADGIAGSASIVVENTAPTLSGISITPTGTVYNDDVLICAATVTDPDESPVPTFEWTVGGSVIGSSATLDLSQTGVMPDDVVTCTVSVTDSDGASATDTIAQTITNRAPTLSNTTITPNSGITTDTALLCETTVADDDGESLTPTYTWTIGSNSYTGASLQLDSTMVTPGDTITCTVDVTDGYGGTATDTTTVNANNTNPVISDVSITYTGDLTSTTQLTCAYIATDADNQTLTPTYTWTNLSTNTQFASTASTLQLTPSTVGPNEVVECSVTVTDTSNGTDAMINSEAVGNTDPTFLTPATITTSGTQVGDTWTCFASGTDQDDGAITPIFQWQDASGGLLASGATLILSAGNSNPNADISCVATIADNNGGSATSSDLETVLNTGPTFTSAASISPSTAVTSTLLICSGTASDADGDTPTLAYAWTNSNGTTYGSIGNTLQLTPSTVVPNETVTCTMTATDSQGDSIQSFSSIAIDNTLPSVTASVSANGSTNTSELTCSATTSDVDDFPSIPSITYEWFNANGSLGTMNPLTLDATMGVDGDTIDCIATATDLTGDAATDTASHTITNTPPVIDSITLSPNTIDASTNTVTCVVSSSDSDGDTVTETFAWYVDTQLQSETTNMYSGPFIVGTLLACRATPNDGKTDGNFVEDTATIENIAPVVDSVTLTPSTVYTNDTITATAVLSDADSSQSGSLTATYEWFVDGSSVQNGSSNTLNGTTMFDRDQSVYVEATANDGVEGGSPVQSSAITVSNTAPVMTSVTVTPDPATAGQDDLTCDAVATDADGDAILYTYEWSDSSGVQQTMTEVSDVSDTFLATGLAEDTWTCDVTPYDGTDYGASVSGSATVESGCSSLEFDGVNDFVDLGTGLNLQNFTIEAWIRTSFSQGTIIAKHLDASYDSSWLLYTSSFLDAPSIYYTSQTSQILTAPGDTSIADNKYHNVIAQFDGSQLSLYVDGVLVSNTITSSPIKQTSVPVGIGARRNSSNTDWNELFTGIISTIKISDSALYSGSSITISPETLSDSATIALWDFSTGSGSTLYDQSGNGHHGTINGATWVDTCPEEDLDGDGVAAWEDCDDTTYDVDNLCMVAHYPFNGNTTDIITGTSGSNNGASLTTGADGQSNSAYNFSGHFMAWNGYSLDATQGFSASLWFNSNVSSSDDKTLLSSSANNDQYTMMFGTFEPEKKLRIRLEDNWSGINWMCDQVYTNNTWHHTVVTWDGGQNLSSMQIYLDGSPCTMSRNSQSSITVFDMEDFWVGGRWGLADYVDGQQFEGSIDDVRVFDTVLTSTQVDVLFQTIQ